jgi:hypothetical protein
MTAGAPAVGKAEAAIRDCRRAETLLRRANLPTLPGVAEERQVAMLARVLGCYDPFGSGHGRLLAAALRPRNRKERDAGPRPAAEYAVRQLLARGEPPWPRAVQAAERVEQRRREHRQARCRQLVELAPTADRDGQAAAQLVADHWREHDRPPSPAELGEALGWPTPGVWALVHLLIEAGWLAGHRGRLRPGPRARAAQPVLSGRG